MKHIIGQWAKLLELQGIDYSEILLEIENRVVELINGGHTSYVRDVLKTFGVSKVSHLSHEQLKPFLEKLNTQFK